MHPFSSCHCLRGVALLLAVSCAVAARAAEIANDQGQSYRRVLLLADLALARGAPAEAVALYEQAAHINGEHVEAEIGVSRAYMAAGEYRRALSYAHLASGEHLDSDAALAWLAYLEDRAGYVDSALKRLRGALTRWPAPSASAAALAEVLLERGRGEEAQNLLSSWHAPAPRDIARLTLRAARATQRMVEGADQAPLRAPGLVADGERARWPAPPFVAVPASFANALARGNGVLVDGGKHILTRVSMTPEARIVARSGDGQLRHAVVAQQVAGVSLLTPERPYPQAAALRVVRHDLASDGVRFCFVLGRSVLAAGSAAYPSLTAGMVLGTHAKLGELMQISVPLSVDDPGSPVFDTSGRLIGLALGSQQLIDGVTDRDRELGGGHFATRGDAFATLLPAVAPPPPAPGSGTVTTDELYERLSAAVVEVWVLPATDG